MSKIHLETERLLLREIDPQRDFEPWAACFGQASTMKYLLGGPMSKAAAWRSMATVMGHWAIRGFGFFSLEDKATGAWVGRAGPWNPEGWPQPEVGWTIAPEYRQQGYAAEAGAASIDYAYKHLGWDAVAHVIKEGNAGSIAVAEKIGSRYLRTENSLPGLADIEVLIYGQNR
ncbi:MAG: GNAT family N-acetyltransferase [bacterium]